MLEISENKKDSHDGINKQLIEWLLIKDKEIGKYEYLMNGSLDYSCADKHNKLFIFVFKIKIFKSSF